MPNYHLIAGDVVVNTVAWDAPPPADVYPGCLVIAATGGGPGWIWDGETLSPPVIVEPVPGQITRLQLILGLTSAGLISAEAGMAAASGSAIPPLIEAVFATLPADQAVGARIRWNAMTTVERLNPLVDAVAAGSGLSADEMDQKFRDWSRL